MSGDPRAVGIRDGYAPVAAAYAEELSGELAGKPLDRAFLDAYAEVTRGAGRVVEIGCGPGQIAAYLHARGVAVEGLDLSPEMVAEATARHPGVAFCVGDMFALPYGDGALAGVVAFYAIVHAPTADLPRPIAELARVLAPGGLAAIAFHAGSEQIHLDAMFGRPTALDFWFHAPEAVAAALEAAGLVIEARLDRAPYPGVEHASRRTYLLARRPR